MKQVVVECYSGGKADERPRRVFIEQQSHEITRVLSESVEEEYPTRNRGHHYRVITEDGSILDLLRRDDGVWYLISG